MDWKRLSVLVAALPTTLFSVAIGLAQSKKPLVRMNYSASIYTTAPVVGVEKDSFVRFLRKVLAL